ncbi:MAG TPA: sigma-70 family RNA polymerase sigma factor [Ktedonobacterales bacterium]|nr:sigma-70 family RNA polymerase sigma factor [Ktedonobacterales bacterium]
MGSERLANQELEDERLAKQVADGDAAALEQLYDRYGQAVYSLALRIVRDPETAEELTQEVFVRLWRYAATFDPTRGRFSGWLLGIAHNLSLNEVRRWQSRPQKADLPGDDDERAYDPVDESADSAEAAWLNIRREAIVGAIRQLPEAQQRAIELAFFGGYTHLEIANMLGDPLGTIKSRIRIGMQRLKQLLLEQGIEAE